MLLMILSAEIFDVKSSSIAKLNRLLIKYAIVLLHWSKCVRIQSVHSKIDKYFCLIALNLCCFLNCIALFFLFALQLWIIASSMFQCMCKSSLELLMGSIHQLSNQEYYLTFHLDFD